MTAPHTARYRATIHRMRRFESATVAESGCGSKGGIEGVGSIGRYIT
jgi:hypothetical protein